MYIHLYIYIYILYIYISMYIQQQFMIDVLFLLTAFPIHAFLSHDFPSSWHPSGVPHITTSEKFLISLHLRKWSQKKTVGKRSFSLFSFFYGVLTQISQILISAFVTFPLGPRRYGPTSNRSLHRSAMVIHGMGSHGMMFKSLWIDHGPNG